MRGKHHHLWNNHHTPMCLTTSSMTTKLPSYGNYSFGKFYPHVTPYQGYETLAYPYLLARVTMMFDIPMLISWVAMGIRIIPLCGLYSLINF